MDHMLLGILLIIKMDKLLSELMLVKINFKYGIIICLNSSKHLLGLQFRIRIRLLMFILLPMPKRAILSWLVLVESIRSSFFKGMGINLRKDLDYMDLKMEYFLLIIILIKVKFASRRPIKVFTFTNIKRYDFYISLIKLIICLILIKFIEH